MTTLERLTDTPVTTREGSPQYVVYRDAPNGRWEFRFKVKGRGYFPLGMLWRDQCYPADGDSAAAIGPADLKERSVQLVSLQSRHRWLPTFGRWSSFGWSVESDA